MVWKYRDFFMGSGESVSFDNNRTRIYFVLTLKKFITKTKFRQQNVFIPLAFHIKCANNFNNSKTQHQAKNIKVYIFLSEAIRYNKQSRVVVVYKNTTENRKF